MAAETKTSVAARFVAYAFPSAADFGTLIDSYTDASDALEAIATAARTGSKGVVYVSGASAVSFNSAGSVGLQMLNTATTAAALGKLGGTTIGQSLFTTSTTAAAQGAVGGGAVGVIVFGAATTAAVQAITGVASAATQAELEAASASSVFVTPERARDLPMMPKAWAMISGGTSPELKAQYNISTLTRTTTGHYRVVFSRVMSDANYAVIASMRTEGGAFYLGMQNSALTVSAGGTGLRVTNTGGTDADPAGLINIAVFGDH